MIESLIKSLDAQLQTYPHVLLAVSGGADSMAMLHLLHQACPDLKLSVCTINHGVRPEAEAEVAFVKEVCQDLGVDFYPEALSLETKTQDAFRQGRYDLLEKVALACKAEAILTAHTLDDQLETLLMRFLKGSDVEGLRGIASQHADLQVPVVRPLLEVEKVDLVTYLQSHNHKWVEDPSNATDKYERNRLRKFLAQEDIPAKRALTIIKKNAATTDYLERGIRTFMADHVTDLTLDRAAFQSLPDALKQRVLSQLLQRCNPQVYAPKSKTLEQLITVIESADITRKTAHGCLIHIRKKTLSFELES